MKVHYRVQILKPETHIVSVSMFIPLNGKDKVSVFLPSWSPGSYLMREYSKHLRSITVLSEKGEYLFFSQVKKGEWLVDLKKSDLKELSQKIEVKYEVYCHELTVRTSHVDITHAYLHGPTYLMGVVGSEIKPTIEFRFPPLWSKLNTSLEDISEKREVFLYEADNYDDLLDSPVEIGCHESNGFMYDKKEHYLVFYGDVYPHERNLGADMKKIVETVSSHFKTIPYEKYTFITHFVKNIYGGLEHHDSTALHFDGRKLSSRKDYLNFLALVAHEYFHTWNVKRIRPIELGPFDYQNENYTKMHWLTEGLTSFMDDLFVFRAGFSTLSEYLEIQKDNLARYFSIPGRKFHSLEDSSFNAWIKLYRPDEFSDNSSISYYLKGGLVFTLLHLDLLQQGKSINDFLNLLWDRYLENPKVGMEEEEVFLMIKKLGGEDVLNNFLTRIKTTQEIDFETYYKKIGAEFIWEEKDSPYLGVSFEGAKSNPIISKVYLDGPAYKCGLNVQDEIIAINRQRVSKEDLNSLDKFFTPNRPYRFLISRQSVIYEIEVTLSSTPRTLREIRIVDEEKLKRTFLS